ncbi:MAG: hypothetical protein VW270_03955 [Candidatus Poseidoniales archaeon]
MPARRRRCPTCGRLSKRALPEGVVPKKRTLTPYQIFAKEQWKSDAILKLAPKERLREIGRRWKAKKSNSTTATEVKKE